MAVLTYSDLLVRAQDYMGQTAPDTGQQRDARRAIQSAFRELASAHRWSLYYQQGQLNTTAPYSTGTVTYTHTGGTYARQLVLDGGTWPTWAAKGMIQVAANTYEVASRIDGTTIQLSVSSNPGADIAAGSAYVISQDQYDLPCDFVACDNVQTPQNWCGLDYVHPRDWKYGRTMTVTNAIPRMYSIIGSRRSFNTLCMAFYPSPDAAYGLTYIYQRRPRALNIDQYRDGTITTAATSTTVTGTGTTFTSGMVNSVLRIAADATDYPTGPDGANQPIYERTIVAYNSATSVTVDSAIDTTLTGVKYEISDPVDIEQGQMETALIRGVELQLAMYRKEKQLPAAQAMYDKALSAAMSGDDRTFVQRGVGWQDHRWLSMRRMPLAADQP